MAAAVFGPDWGGIKVRMQKVKGHDAATIAEFCNQGGEAKGYISGKFRVLPRAYAWLGKYLLHR